MSMPTFPEDGIDITRDQAFNMLLGSIAMEELGLSHIINAEGEKLQYVLGTLSPTVCPKVSTKELLEVNKSITTMMEHVAHNQFLLKGKMTQVLEAQEKWSPPPCPPPCPPHCPCPCHSHCHCHCHCHCHRPLHCHDQFNKFSVFQENGEDAWYAEEYLAWQAVHQGEDMRSANASFTTLNWHAAKQACLVNFDFELLPVDSGQVAIELLQVNNGAASPILKSGVYAATPDQPVYISGSTVIAPRPEDMGVFSLAFALCESQMVRVKKARLTLMAL